MPSRDFTNEDLFSSPMMSMHNSTHSSQMKTVGPAMSLRTSCWLLPQNVQWSGFLVSPLLTLLISELRLDASRRSRYPAGGDAPDFVEVGEAGIAMDDAMRRQRRVQLVGGRTWIDELQAQL